VIKEKLEMGYLKKEKRIIRDKSWKLFSKEDSVRKEEMRMKEVSKKSEERKLEKEHKRRYDELLNDEELLMIKEKLRKVREEKDYFYSEKNKIEEEIVWNELKGMMCLVLREDGVSYFRGKNNRGRISKGKSFLLLEERKENLRRMMCIVDGGIVSVSKNEIRNRCLLISDGEDGLDLEDRMKLGV
jgi:hypothetical protein|tara:strand:+ start:11 stop:568 length:558 start_codon:yes stop_codon:yes gene_type:complete